MGKMAGAVKNITLGGEMRHHETLWFYHILKFEMLT